MLSWREKYRYLQIPAFQWDFSFHNVLSSSLPKFQCHNLPHEVAGWHYYCYLQFLDSKTRFRVK